MMCGFICLHAKTDLVIEKPIKIKGLHISPNNKGAFVVRGSLHKYFNNGEHNANDYSMSDFSETLKILYNEIELNPEITPVNGFEFGVNIIPPLNPNSVLNCIILHKTMAKTKTENGYKEFVYNNYSFKIYNKSQLTKIEPYQSGDILRIEVSAKMAHLKPKGVYSKVLSDFLSVDIWERLEKILIETVEECLIIDLTEIEVNQLSDKLKLKYYQYINPLFWTTLHQDRTKYHRERNRCNKFLNQYAASTLKQDIIRLIETKCKELRNISDDIATSQKCNVLTVFEVESKKGEMQQINHLDNTIKRYTTTPETVTPIEGKFCATCGRKIEHPRTGQKYCSAKEVGENQAHKCRNTESNPRNNTKNSIRRIVSIGLLFELSDIVAPSKQCYL